jgi:hypothetical protein
MFEHETAAEDNLVSLFDADPRAALPIGRNRCGRGNIALADVFRERRSNDWAEVELSDDFHGSFSRTTDH